MFEIHSNLGELVVVVYMTIATLAVILANRGGLPAWLTGIGHTLLTLQVIIGIAMVINNPTNLPWSHIVVGLLTIPVLGLMFPLKKRLGATQGTAIGALAVAIVAAIAVILAISN